MTITLIVAMDEKGTIGVNHGLPWHLPADLAYFKQHTLNKTLVMGRKTYESIGKPLPNRKNIVMTSNKQYSAPGCTVQHSVDAVVAEIPANDELMVIGGATIYKAFLPLATGLRITRVHHTVAGDTVFPPYDESQWRLVEQTHRAADEHNPYAMTFAVYDRISKT